MNFLHFKQMFIIFAPSNKKFCLQIEWNYKKDLTSIVNAWNMRNCPCKR